MSLKYALITPAKNEEEFIERTIVSVIHQTVRPNVWVIVSDGSVDRTDEIVSRYTGDHDWMSLLRLPSNSRYDFASKARCFNAGYEKIQHLDFDIIGNLDADVEFGADYFEYLIKRFEEDPKLGVAGTPMVEENHDPVADGVFNESDVFGACQIFRRECFRDVGGYTPIKWGGIDWVALRTARMNGWKTRSFMGKRFFHLRPMGETHGNVFKARFDYGMKDYFLGNHPLWEVLRLVYQVSQKPYLIGSICMLAGYVGAFAMIRKRPISDELMRFHRAEQMQRIKTFLGRVTSFWKESNEHN